jgi:lysophospholipase L1-like esterase
VKRTFVAAFVAILLAVPSAALAETPDHASVPVYLALGDSLSTGVGASVPSQTGYVPLFHEYLRRNLSCEGRGESEGCAALRLNNIGVSGATTTTLLRDQLPLALAELEARNQDANPRNDVEVITIDIGGNDAFPLLQVCGGGVTAECAEAIQTTFAQIAQNLTLTLTQLRAAAGPDTEIIVMTYYNPLPGCVFAPAAPLGDLVLEGGPGLPAGLNDIIRAIAAGVDASVAETFGRLGVQDLVGGSDCLHADDSGYAIIANALAGALPD